jgi:hypothetical protein
LNPRELLKLADEPILVFFLIRARAITGGVRNPGHNISRNIYLVFFFFPFKQDFGFPIFRLFTD